MNENIRTRVGKFKFRFPDTATDETADVFGMMKFIPMNIDSDYHEFTTFGGRSHLFDELETGEMIPEYLIEVQTVDHKVVKVSAKRCED